MFKGALAVDSSLAIISSFCSMKDSEEQGAEITGNGTYIDFGIGKFWTINDSEWIAELFIGTGFSSIKNKVNMNNLNVKYFTPFVQPSIGYRNAFFEFAFTPKLAMINYTSMTNELADPDQHISAEDFYESNKTQFAIEPGFTFRLGWESVKIHWQTVYSSFEYNGLEDTSPVNYLFTSFGIFFRIQPKRSILQSKSSQWLKSTARL